ncbi:putative methyltransferase [Candidatus Bathyarchaeota archaeon]|nr:MAG: putative methyltransferase [Candidatus Bathyarchaeota archaeon]
MRKVETYILNELAASKRTIWELLNSANFPLKDFVEAIKTLHKNGLISADQEGLYLTEKGKREVDPKILEFESEICPKCLGKRIVFGEKFEEILKEFKKIARQRPRPTLDFFQGYMQEEDVIARVALMHHYGDLHKKEFILIGDDDLLSIALSLTGLPSRITVLDIDRRLGDFIKEANKEYGFDIEFRRYNVAEPLPEDLIGNFDVFSSEPLETLTGLKAFVSRGISCLKENATGYFGLTILEASHKKWLAIQRLLSRMNCVITDIISGFSAYPMDYGTVNYETFVRKLGIPVGKNPGINWYKSALYRFEVLGKPKLVVDPRKKLRIKFIDPEEDITHPILE